jgi:hypothetical protein
MRKLIVASVLGLIMAFGATAAQHVDTSGSASILAEDGPACASCW